MTPKISIRFLLMMLQKMFMIQNVNRLVWISSKAQEGYIVELIEEKLHGMN